MVVLVFFSLPFPLSVLRLFAHFIALSPFQAKLSIFIQQILFFCRVFRLDDVTRLNDKNEVNNSRFALLTKRSFPFLFDLLPAVTLSFFPMLCHHRIFHVLSKMKIARHNSYDNEITSIRDVLSSVCTDGLCLLHNVLSIIFFCRRL